MENLESLQQKQVVLNLDGVPPSQWAMVKSEIGDMIINEIISNLSEGKSPVEKHSFDKLSESYAKKQKGGDDTPNLNLHGDLIDSLDHKPNADNSINIGVFKKNQLGKAEGHNQFEGKSKLSLRRFIPSTKENFKKDIQNQIDSIIESYSVGSVDNLEVELTLEQEKGISKKLKGKSSNEIEDLVSKAVKKALSGL